MIDSVHSIIQLPPLPELPTETQCFSTYPLSWIQPCKHYLEQGMQSCTNAFNNKMAIRHIYHARAQLIDKLLIHLWQISGRSQERATLVAVGGYGRAELAPQSDIDLLILIHQKMTDDELSAIQAWITFLWDIGLTLGESIRTLEECIQLSEQDLSVMTNLMESRMLIGHKKHYVALSSYISEKTTWSSHKFYTAKVNEQHQRYLKYNSSSYDLEPNLKTSPGGLRDIQLMGWIAKHHFKHNTLQELAHQGVFSLKEYKTLLSCQYYLWRIRFVLHNITHRCDDRLLFEHQKIVAEKLGYQNTSESLAVEKLMKKYFRSVITIRNLTELLLQVFEELFLEKQQNIKNIPNEKDFHLVNDRISIIDNKKFIDNPSLLLKIFIISAQTKGHKKISAQTLRAIRDNRHLIDANFRNDPLNKQLFLTFFSIKHHNSHSFFLMKRHGILAEFLPAFKNISGQMQFDMFHSYTVDEHTLFLIKNLTHFCHQEAQNSLPICYKIMQDLEKVYLIYFAGLFHDIAKGRGGDHSTLGAKDALEFCTNLGLSDDDAQLIAWLVEHHLIMSATSQRKDISNPNVIQEFISEVNSQEKLDLMYILTVADIQATSPKLWNAWKDALLKELYMTASNHLCDTKNISTHQELSIDTIKSKTEQLLKQQKISMSATHAHWDLLDDNYFRYTPIDRIVWQTSCVIKHAHPSNPLVEIRQHRNESGTEIFIFSQDQADLFATITATLNQKQLNIQMAELFTNNNNYCLDTFIVLEEDGRPIRSTKRTQSIKKRLQKNLKNIKGFTRQVHHHAATRLKEFSVETKISFINNELLRYTQLDLTVRDQPGLLARIGEAFKHCQIKIHSARIITLGEKVEDTFLISTWDDRPVLDLELQEKVKQSIIQHLRTP